MIANNVPLAYAFKPLHADLREQLSLVGDHAWKNHVKCADAIGGDYDDSRTFAGDIGQFIQVAHLANTFSTQGQMRLCDTLRAGVAGRNWVDIVLMGG